MRHEFYDAADLNGVQDHELERAVSMLNQYFGETVTRNQVSFEVKRTKKGPSIALIDREQTIHNIDEAKSTARAVVRSALNYR